MTTYTPPAENVEAVRLALHQALAPVWMSVANALGGDQGQYDEMLRDLATAALTAAGPLVEQDVQERIATLIEAQRFGQQCCDDALAFAARIARGEGRDRPRDNPWVPGRNSFA